MKFFENNSIDQFFYEKNKQLFYKLGLINFIQIDETPQYFGYYIDQYDGILGRLKAIELASPKDGDIILDAGCYYGFLSILCALWADIIGLKLKIIGIDLFEKNINKCKKNAKLFKLSNVEFYQADLVSIELIGGVDIQIFYRSLRKDVGKQPEFMDFYGTNYDKVLNNTIKYLSSKGTIIIYDTENDLIEICYEFLNKEFNCTKETLYHGFLLKAVKLK